MNFQLEKTQILRKLNLKVFQHLKHNKIYSKIDNRIKLSIFGKMAEWSIASDLKSDEPQGSVSSNLTLPLLNIKEN